MEERNHQNSGGHYCHMQALQGSVNFKKEVPLHHERDPVVLLTEAMHWDNELCYFGYQCDEENHGIPICQLIVSVAIQMFIRRTIGQWRKDTTRVGLCAL